MPFKPKLLIEPGARARGCIQNSFWNVGEEVAPSYHFSLCQQYGLIPCNLYLLLCLSCLFFSTVILNITPHNICNAYTYYYEKQGCPVVHPCTDNKRTNYTKFASEDRLHELSWVLKRVAVQILL